MKKIWQVEELKEVSWTISYLNRIKRGVLTFVAVIIAGVFLLLLSQCFPIELIHEHVRESTDIFAREEGFPQKIKGYDASVPDNNTDAWMILIADYHNETRSLADRIFGGYYYVYTYESTGLPGIDNIGYVGSDAPVYDKEYTRYWHGWMFFLRLLLCFMDYETIRVLNLGLMVILCAEVLIGFWFKKYRGLIIPFIISILIMFPYVMTMCMAYMISFYIMSISILVLVYKGEKLRETGNVALFFMLIGMVTAYSEFLQFPVITLGFPLVVYIYKRIDDADAEISSMVKSVLVLSFAWAVGYFGMWISKWVIAAIFTDNNAIATAFEQIRIRTSGTSDFEMTTTMNRWDSITACFGKMNKWPFIVGIGVSTLGYIGAFVFHGFKETRRNMAFILPYAMIAFIPFVWALLFANHTYMHAHFTYRIFAVTAFAFYACAAEFLKGEK